MVKVLYNNKEIELKDQLEFGYMELDMLTSDEKANNLEDTIELRPINLEDTIELRPINLEDTQGLDLGDIYE